MGKVHFLTFGGGNQKFYNFLINICKQASKFNIFSTINGITDISLKKDKYFWSKHGEFIDECVKNNIRGYGCWLWKPYIVKKKLSEIDDNDIIVYADSGSLLNLNGRKRLLEYIDIVSKSETGSLAFKHNKEWKLQEPIEGHIEKEFTKGSIFDELNARDPKISDTSQLIGCTFILRKCEHTIKMVDLWYETCCKYELLLDEPYSDTSYPEFREHRHDQSIFSIIRKLHGTEYIDNEVYFGSVGWNSKTANESPIWQYQLTHKVKNI